MTTAFFEKPKFSRENVAKVFGSKSDARLAQRIKTEDPALYAEMRQEAVALGLVGPQREHFWAHVYDNKAEREFSPEEVTARARFSEQQCREIFKSKVGEGVPASDIKKSDPETYRLAKIAAASYGILEGTSGVEVRDARHKPVRPATTPDVNERIAINDDLADRAHLPRGTRVSPDRIAEIVNAVAEAELARRNAGKTQNETEQK